MIDALTWLKTHADNRQPFVSCTEVPIDGVVRPQLQEFLIETAPDGADRIHRINYEISNSNFGFARDAGLPIDA